MSLVKIKIYNSKGEVVDELSKAETCLLYNIQADDLEYKLKYQTTHNYKKENYMFESFEDKRNAFDKEAEAYFKMNREQALFCDGYTEKIKNMKKEKDALGGQDGGNYDDKGNSAHYQSQFMEYIRDQERKYGTAIAYIVCISQADKYAQRAGIKAGVPAEKDLTKRMWYLATAQYLKAKLDRYNSKSEGPVPHDNAFVPLAEEIEDVLFGRSNYLPLAEAIKDYQ